MLNKDWILKSKRDLMIMNYHENMDKYVFLVYLSLTILFGTLLFSFLLLFNIYGIMMLIGSVSLYTLTYPLILTYKKKAYNYYEEAYILSIKLNDKIKKKHYKKAFLERQFSDLKECKNYIKTKFNKLNIAIK